MKIKSVLEVEDTQKFEEAYNIVEELAHLYDGIDYARCKAYADAASYMLDIVNGNRVVSKEV